ncbi:cell division protein FtsN [Pasteurella sp. PK-2025]|uniref:cell division protein FtsN n=1 Tax=unclassified Pasteurella TaxID=2621516 RepID=UPI003C7743DE
MARRSYPARGGKKKKGTKNKTAILLFVIAVVVIFGLGLFMLKEKAPEAPVAKKTEKTEPKSVLPSRPEEVWSYIQALETRTVPVDDNPKSLDKNMRLTAEQKKILLAMEKEQQQAEQARLKQVEERKKAEENGKKDNVSPQTREAELTKTPSTSSPAVVVEAKASESKKVDTVRKVEKPIERVVEKPVERTEPVKTASARQYGLQCGAFKNKTQAENLQARLALAGLNARVNASEEWNRVIVGPVGERSAALKSQEKAKSITSCVVIGM